MDTARTVVSPVFDLAAFMGEQTDLVVSLKAKGREDFPLLVKYRANAISGASLAKYRQRLKDGNQEDAVWDILEETLAWWNVADAKTGGNLAVTPESIRATSILVTAQVAFAIVGKMGEALTPVTS